MITTTAILTNIQYGVPSGPYDGFSQDWVSEPVQAVNYYQGQGFVQTITVDVTGFQGSIEFQATVDSGADSSSWTTVGSYPSTDPAPSMQSFAITGNWAWIRARVIDFQSGTINLIQIRY